MGDTRLPWPHFFDEGNTLLLEAMRYVIEYSAPLGYNRILHDGKWHCGKYARSEYFTKGLSARYSVNSLSTEITRKNIRID